MAGSNVDRAAAIESWYDAYATALRRFVTGLTRDTEQVEDVLQAVFAKALTNAPERLLDAAVEEGDSKVRAWLFTVARNEVVTRTRRVAAEARGVSGKGKRSIEQNDAEAALLQQEDARRVQEAVANLSDAERRLVRQHWQDGWTYARVAEDSGEPLGTVLSRASRLIEKLRKALGPDE